VNLTIAALTCQEPLVVIGNAILHVCDVSRVRFGLPYIVFSLEFVVGTAMELARFYTFRGGKFPTL
jgi:hypothetical protein